MRIFHTLNKMLSRFLCREFLIKCGKIFTYLACSILFLNVIVRIQQTRAQLSLTQNRAHLLFIHIFREREKTCVYILSRLRLLFARIIYCVVVNASKIISLRIREKKEK